MKKNIILFFVIILITSITSYAQEIAITESGKKVILFENGTYKWVDDKEKNIKTEISFELLDTITKKNVTYLLTKEKYIYMKNGSNDLTKVKVDFLAIKELFIENIEIEKLNLIIGKASLKTKYSMKNPSSYIPKSIQYSLINEKQNRYSITISYTAQNSYGGAIDGYSSVKYSDEGEFTDILLY